MRIGVDPGGTRIEAIVLDGQDSIVRRERILKRAHDYPGVLRANRDFVSRLQKVAAVRSVSVRRALNIAT